VHTWTNLHPCQPLVMLWRLGQECGVHHGTRKARFSRWVGNVGSVRAFQEFLEV
jgi:hypothetical protein